MKIWSRLDRFLLFVDHLHTGNDVDRLHVGWHRSGKLDAVRSSCSRRLFRVQPSVDFFLLRFILHDDWGDRRLGEGHSEMRRLGQLVVVQLLWKAATQRC